MTHQRYFVNYLLQKSSFSSCSLTFFDLSSHDKHACNLIIIRQFGCFVVNQYLLQSLWQTDSYCLLFLLYQALAHLLLLVGPKNFLGLTLETSCCQAFLSHSSSQRQTKFLIVHCEGNIYWWMCVVSFHHNYKLCCSLFLKIALMLLAICCVFFANTYSHSWSWINSNG